MGSTLIVAHIHTKYFTFNEMRDCEVEGNALSSGSVGGQLVFLKFSCVGKMYNITNIATITSHQGIVRQIIDAVVCCVAIDTHIS